AKALVQRLQTLDVKTLAPDDIRQTIQTTRATIDGLNRTIAQVQALEHGVDSGVGRIKAGVNGLDDALRTDYAYARSLIKLPSLEAPDISPALFGQTALDRLQPVMYWLHLAEHYMPAGLKARLHPG